MDIENWIDLLVPIIGILVAGVSAGLTYYFAKKQQIEADEQRLKEKYYLAYIAAVSNMVISNNDNRDEARNRLADAINQLLLTGSSNVVKSLMVFHDYLNRSNCDIGKHNELLTELIKNMRIDLYKNKKVNIDYPLIHLTRKS